MDGAVQAGAEIRPCVGTLIRNATEGHAMIFDLVFFPNRRRSRDSAAGGSGCYPNNLDNTTRAHAMKSIGTIAMIGVITVTAASCSGPNDPAGNSVGGLSAAIKGVEQKHSAAEDASVEASRDAAPIPDACALISQAIADAVLGTPGKLSEHEKDDQFASHCNYEAVDQNNGANNFGVEIHTDENAADAKQGQAINKGLYSNIKLYDYQVLSGIGDEAFLAVSKPPGAGFESGPLAAMVAHQQILMLVKGSKDIEITVSYFGKERSTDGLKVLAKSLADKS
jgi:hypothetical protein